MSASSKPSVLVTGASGGIGGALVREFQSLGYTVFATARNPSSISSLAALPNVHVLALDVCDGDSIVKAREAVSAVTGGTLDVLFNNAGMSGSAPAAEPNLSDVRRMFETNLFGIMATVKEFVPLVIKAKGRIVSVASTAGLIGLMFSSTYTASKAALFAYSDALRLELAPFGVKVSAVSAGGVETVMYKGQSVTIQPNSIYAPASADIEKSLKTRAERDVMPAPKFAKSVIKQALSNNPPRWIWGGTGAGLIWFMHAFLPKTFMDYILNSLLTKVDWSVVQEDKKTK